MIDQATLDTDRHAEPFLDLPNVCMFLMKGSSKGSGESSKDASREGLILSLFLIRYYEHEIVLSLYVITDSLVVQKVMYMKNMEF